MKDKKTGSVPFQHYASNANRSEYGHMDISCFDIHDHVVLHSGPSRMRSNNGTTCAHLVLLTSYTDCFYNTFLSMLFSHTSVCITKVLDVCWPASNAAKSQCGRVN